MVGAQGARSSISAKANRGWRYFSSPRFLSCLWLLSCSPHVEACMGCTDGATACSDQKTTSKVSHWDNGREVTRLATYERRPPSMMASSLCALRLAQKDHACFTDFGMKRRWVCKTRVVYCWTHLSTRCRRCFSSRSCAHTTF